MTTSTNDVARISPITQNADAAAVALAAYDQLLTLLHSLDSAD